MAGTALHRLAQVELSLELWLSQKWESIAPLDADYFYIRRLIIFGLMDFGMFISLSLPEAIVKPMIPFDNHNSAGWDILYAVMYAAAGILCLIPALWNRKLTSQQERAWRVIGYGATLVASLSWGSLVVVSATLVTHDWTRVVAWFTLIIFEIWGLQLQVDAPSRQDLERVTAALDKYETDLGNTEAAGSKE